jgi:hypothetical protein
MKQIVYEEAIEISPKGSGNPDWDKRRNFLPGRCRALTTILLCAATFTRPMVAATVLGTVAGTVVDGTGKPVSNAHVTISFALPANGPVWHARHLAGS